MFIRGCLLICFVAATFSFARADLPPGFTELGNDSLFDVSPDGKQVAYWNPAKANQIQTLAVDSGQAVHSYPLEEGTALVSLQYRASDGALCGITSKGRFWSWTEVNAPNSVDLEEVESLSGSFEISRSGKILLQSGPANEDGVGGNVWNLETGERIHAFQGGDSLLTTFSSDEQKVFFVRPKGVTYWDKGTDEEQQIRDFRARLESAQKCPNGRYILGMSRERVELIDVVAGEVDYMDGSAGMSAKFSGTGDRVVIAQGRDNDYKIDVWSLGEGIDDLAFEREYRGRKADPVSVGESEVLYYGHSDQRSLFLQDLGGGDPRLIGFNSGLLQEFRSLPPVTSLDVSPRGTRIAVGLANDTLGVWATDIPKTVFERTTGRNPRRIQRQRHGNRCLGVLSLPSTPTDVRFVGESGSMLITSVDGNTHFVAAPVSLPEELTSIVKYRPEGLRSSSMKLEYVDFSPDGKRLAVALAEGVSVVDVATGKEVEFFPHKFFKVWFDSKGEKIFGVGTQKHGIIDLRRRTFVPMQNFGQPTKQLTGARLGTDFYLIDLGGVVVEADSGRVVNYIPGEQVKRGKQGLSPDGKYVANAGKGRTGSKIILEVTEVETGNIVVSMETQNASLNSVAMLNDGRTAVIGYQNGAAFYDTRRRRLTALIPDERYRDVDDRANQTDRNRALPSIVQRPRVNPDDIERYFMLNNVLVNVQSMALNEASQQILLAESSRVSVWNSETGNLMWMGSLERERVASCALSPDGSTIAIGKQYGEVHLHRIPQTSE